MRFVAFHCTKFAYRVKSKGRSPVVEPLTDDNREGSAEEVVALFLAVEKSDEASPGVVDRVADWVAGHLRRLKVGNVALLSFAHLFCELSSPEFALDATVELGRKLGGRGFDVLRVPFGYFNELEMVAKGHPISRVSRRFD
ncbi:MAG: hypothetical protein Kow0069_24050 [Promethearchaeota archaeon]